MFCIICLCSPISKRSVVVEIGMAWVFHFEQRVKTHTSIVSSKIIASTLHKIIRTKHPCNFTQTYIQFSVCKSDASSSSLIEFWCQWKIQITRWKLSRLEPHRTPRVNVCVVCDALNHVLHTSQTTLWFKRVSGVRNYMAYLSRTATLPFRLHSPRLL